MVPDGFESLRSLHLYYQGLTKAVAKVTTASYKKFKAVKAVVIVTDHSQVVGATVTGPGWSRSVNTISGRVIVAVAIRYTQP